jgi:hypothetical protein
VHQRVRSSPCAKNVVFDAPAEIGPAVSERIHVGDDLHTYTGSADRRADPRIDETGIDETETMPVHFRRSALEAGLKPEIRVGDAEGETPLLGASSVIVKFTLSGALVHE